MRDSTELVAVHGLAGRPEELLTERRLHRLMDPDSTSPDAFYDALDVLRRLVIDSTRD